jgi:osmoprotectant transport system permease protein
VSFFADHLAELGRLTEEHLVLVAIATLAATVVGVPLGVLCTRKPALRRPVLALMSVLQTIPSLALFGILIPLLGRYGIGRIPAIIALFLYSLLPIVRNTFAGIMGVDHAVRDAGRGLGMTDAQLLTKIEFPLALGVITAGIRTATVISVGTATIAAAIGAGGLGTYIFRGLRMNDNRLVLAGAIPAALIALALDLALGGLEHALGTGFAKTTAKRRWIAFTAIATVALAGALAVGFAAQTKGDRVVVCSKDFTEQVILGELLAQTIERAGLGVERRFELGGDLCHRALLAGEVDAYVEYSGTALTTILKERPETDPRAVFAAVRAAYPPRFHAAWLAPLGFDNTFAILVRGDVARRLGLHRISEIAPLGASWRAAFGQDFMSRPDGYPGFVKAYGLSFTTPPREMDLALTYRALGAGQVDVIAGNSTDGLIDELDLTQLDDDRHYFPPYEAAPVVREATLARHPEIEAALDRLGGRIHGSEMRKLNHAVDGEHRDPKAVVREWLDRLGN